MAEGELEAGPLLRLYLEYFGMRAAVRMFGWCVLWGVLGYSRWPQVEAARPPRMVNETTWYTALRQFRGFRAEVARAEGRAVDQVDEEQLARRIVRAAESPEGAGVFANSGVS